MAFTGSLRLELVFGQAEYMYLPIVAQFHTAH